MKDYQLKIAIKTGFSQPITGDHLNGAMLYYLSLTDKQRFAHYYSGFKKQKPPYLFSSFFPEATLPFNGSFFVEKFFADAKKEEIKKLKKIRFVPEDLLDQPSQIMKTITNHWPEKIIKDRLVKVSLKNKTLYTQEIINFDSKKADVYLRVFADDFPLTQLPEFFSFFLGKKISVGLSHLILLNQKEMTLPRSGRFFINLSPFIPRPEEKDDYQPIAFGFLTKFPKIGIKQAGKNPFKKKIVLLKEGSIFQAIRPEKLTFFGTILENVALNGDIIQVTYSFPYFFNL